MFEGCHARCDVCEHRGGEEGPVTTRWNGSPQKTKEVWQMLREYILIIVELVGILTIQIVYVFCHNFKSFSFQNWKDIIWFYMISKMFSRQNEKWRLLSEIWRVIFLNQWQLQYLNTIGQSLDFCRIACSFLNVENYGMFLGRFPRPQSGLNNLMLRLWHLQSTPFRSVSPP